MNKLLLDPDFPVSEMFVETMAILALDPATSPVVLRNQRIDNLAGSPGTELEFAL